MKKTTKLFGLFAVAAMTVIGCSKEIDAPKEEVINEQEDKVVETHTVTISAGTPETKTLINEGVSSASFKWSSDDASRFHIWENDKEGSSIALETSDEYVTVKLTASFATVPAESYTYTAFLAKNVVSGSNPQVPAEQTCTGSSYDPNADILIAQPVTNEGSVLSKIDMKFGRPCVINKMTLKGLVPGETVSSVEIFADKPLTGYYDIAGKEWTGESQKITLATSQLVPTNGQVTVFFITMPVEAATLTVTAITDAHVYNKTFGSAINFVLDQVTKFGVSSLGKYVKRDVLTYATAGFNVTSGSYKAWSGKSYAGVGHSDAVYAGQSCEINSSDKKTYGEYIQLRMDSPSGIISTISGGSVAKVFVVFGGKANVDKRDLTIYGKNTAYTATTDLFDDETRGEEMGAITFNTGDKFGCLNVDGYCEYIGLYSGDGTMYFREIDIFWDSTKEISGLKWTADGNSGDAVADADASIETGNDNMPEAALYNPNGISLSDITFSSSNTDVATVGEHTGVITLVGVGSTNISAAYSGNETYQASTVKYTLSVTDNRTIPVITLTTTDVELTDQNYSSFTGRSATVDQSVTLVYSKTDASSIIDEFNTSTGVLSLNGNVGMATVTVSFAGNAEYKAAESKSYKIIVASSSGPEDRNAPGSPTITAITPTSFTATWAAPLTGGSENGYSWKLSTSSDPDDAAITNGTGNVDSGVLTVTVNSGITLTKDTNYYFHVLTRGDGGTNYNDSGYATSAAKQYHTQKWTATSGAIAGTTSGTIENGDYDWSFTRSNVVYTGWSSNCIQLGSSSGAEVVTLSNSNFSGTIVSVAVECSSYNAAHKVAISVGGNSYLAATATAKWTTVSTKTGTGTSSGNIQINFTNGTRALYIKSITVIYY